MPPRLPSFLGLGAQKSGTTTLFALLRGHPDVYLPPAKELHYFSLHCDRGDDWYRAQFDEATGDQRCGEITPYYLFHPLVPDRIRALTPDVRMVVLLRDPVERCLSQVFHAQRLGFERLPVDEALAAETTRLADADSRLSRGDRHESHQQHSYLARSRYEQQLLRYRQRFPSTQLLVCRSEDLFSGSDVVWRDIQRFIDVRVRPVPSSIPVANRGRGERRGVSDALRRRLREELEPTYAVIDSWYGIRW